MKSFRYLVSNGFKNMWLNKLMTLASIGVLVACMSMIGIAITISEHIDKALNDIEKQNVVMAYFEDKNSVLYGSGENLQLDQNSEEFLSMYSVHNIEDALEVCKEIEKLENVEGVVYISAEDALQSVQEQMPETQAEYFSFMDGENPMSCGARVTLKDIALMEDTVSEIEKITGVESTYSATDLAEKVVAIKHIINIVSVWIIVILMIISLMIVSNTIRVTMYSRKLEISIMKAVGATDSFVRLPFLVEGMAIGVVASIITIVLLYFVYYAVVEVISNTIGIFATIAFAEIALPLFLIFVAIGCISGIVSSYLMINKYLRKEGSEFRAL